MRKGSRGNALVEPTYRAHLHPETYKPAGLRKKLTNAVPSGTYPCNPNPCGNSKFCWRSSSRQQAPSLKEMFFLQTQRLPNFWGFGFWNLRLNLAREFHMVIWNQFSATWKLWHHVVGPAAALLRKDQTKEEEEEIREDLTEGAREIDEEAVAWSLAEAVLDPSQCCWGSEQSGITSMKKAIGGCQSFSHIGCRLCWLSGSRKKWWQEAGVVSSAKNRVSGEELVTIGSWNWRVPGHLGNCSW